MLIPQSGKFYGQQIYLEKCYQQSQKVSIFKDLHVIIQGSVEQAADLSVLLDLTIR